MKRSLSPNRRTLIYLIAQGCCRVLIVVLFRFRTYGTQNVPRRGAIVIASNHQSYLDPVLVGVPLSRPIGFFANAYLFKNRAFGWLIRNLYAFPVERGKGDRVAVNTAIEKLKEGYAINMFPEGTRSVDGKIRPLERGIVLIARRGNAKVVPVAIDGAYDAWPRKRKLFRLCPVHVMYGKPIDPAGMEAQEFLNLLESEIRRMHAELVRRRPEMRDI